MLLVIKVDSMVADIADINSVINTQYWEKINDDVLKEGFNHITYRIILNSILAEKKIKKIADLWDKFDGKHKKIIENKLIEIGIHQPADKLIDFVFSCLSS